MTQAVIRCGRFVLSAYRLLSCSVFLLCFPAFPFGQIPTGFSFLPAFPPAFPFLPALPPTFLFCRHSHRLFFFAGTSIGFFFPSVLVETAFSFFKRYAQRALVSSVPSKKKKPASRRYALRALVLSVPSEKKTPASRRYAAVI